MCVCARAIEYANNMLLIFRFLPIVAVAAAVFFRLSTLLLGYYFSSPCICAFVRALLFCLPIFPMVQQSRRVAGTLAFIGITFHLPLLWCFYNFVFYLWIQNTDIFGITHARRLRVLFLVAGTSCFCFLHRRHRRCRLLSLLLLLFELLLLFGKNIFSPFNVYVFFEFFGSILCVLSDIFIQPYIATAQI